MFGVARSPWVPTVAALLRIRNVAADWSWTIAPSQTNPASCNIPSCSQLYGKESLTTTQLTDCFSGCSSECVFNAIGDPGVRTLPITCAGSYSSSVASLDISGLVPPFYDSFYSNGSAVVVFSAKPEGSTQCDFFPYVGKYIAPAETCSSDVDDRYWVPDPSNGIMTVMTKKFELSLYKVIEQGATGYYLETGNWDKCGGSIESVLLDDNFNVVVSRSGDEGRVVTTSTTPPPLPTTLTTTSSSNKVTTTLGSYDGTTDITGTASTTGAPDPRTPGISSTATDSSSTATDSSSTLGISSTATDSSSTLGIANTLTTTQITLATSSTASSSRHPGTAPPSVTLDTTGATSGSEGTGEGVEMTLMRMSLGLIIGLPMLIIAQL